MPTLLDLSVQGDVGTLADESRLRPVKLMDPQQLYELWGRQPWEAHSISLERDVADWQGMSQEGRGHRAWLLPSSFIGGERGTTQFSRLVAACASGGAQAFVD